MAHRDDVTSRSWGFALLGSAAVLIGSFLGFVYVPDFFVNHVLQQTAPRTRDSLVLLWVAVFFVFDCWLFVRLQRGRHGAVRG